MVIITSNEGSLEVPIDPSTQIFQVHGLQLPLVEIETEWNLEEPVLKPQLVWEPSLDTNSDGQLEISYRQSDDVSQFQIEVVAQSKDGRRGYGRMVYQIVD